MTFQQIEARMDAIGALERQRPLTDAEQAELDNLAARRSQHLRRAYAQIERAEAKLRRLRSMVGERIAA